MAFERIFVYTCLPPVLIASMSMTAAGHALVVQMLIELSAAVERLPLQVLYFETLCVYLFAACPDCLNVGRRC